MNGFQYTQGVSGYGNTQLAGPIQSGQPNGTAMSGQPNYGNMMGQQPMVGRSSTMGNPAMGGGYAPGFAPQSPMGQSIQNPNMLQYGPQAMQNYTQNATYAGPAAGYINNFSVGGANGPANSLNSNMGGLNNAQINSINQAMGGQQLGSRGIGSGLGQGAFDTYGAIPGQGGQLGSIYNVGGQQYGQDQLQGVLSGFGTQLQGLNSNIYAQGSIGTPSNLGQLYGDLQSNPWLSNPVASDPGMAGGYFSGFNNDPSAAIYQPGYNAQTNPFLNQNQFARMGGVAGR